jgi:hypothetical protein
MTNLHHLFKGCERLLRLGELNFECRHFTLCWMCETKSVFSGDGP